MQSLRTPILALLVIATTSMSACSGGGPGEPIAKMVPNPSNSLETESRDGGLPAEFPRKFPLPKDRRVVYSAVSSFGVVAYFTTPDPDAAVKNLMLTKLSEAGWTLNICRSTDTAATPVTTMVFSNATSVASIQVGYTTEAASRLAGTPFSFFVSIADTTNRPTSTSKGC